MKKRSKTLTRLTVALAGLGALVSSQAMADMQISTKGGLKVYDPNNPCYWFCLNGRVDIDEVLFSGAYQDRQNNFASSANIRRALLALSGGVGEGLSYNLTLDFGRSHRIDNGLTSNTVSTSHGHTLIQDAWLAYTGLWDGSRLRIGQFTPLSTMDFYGNDGTGNGQMFLESALATMTFNVPSYLDTDSRLMKGLGVILETQWNDCFTVAATVYQPPHGSGLNYNNSGRSDRLGEALRVTYAPIHESDQVFHLGVMGRHQSLNHSNAGGPVYNNLFFTPPEVLSRNYIGQHRTVNGLWNNDPNLLNAGLIRARNYVHTAGEALAISGPLTFQGEYHHMTVHRQADVFNNTGFTPANLVRAGNVKFHGWHAQGGYVLTGESRCYDFATGTLGGIKPCGPWGAWEVVARYSYLTLMAKDVYGGSAHNITAGLNWYANDNIRVGFNYIRANINPTNTALTNNNNQNNQAGIPPASAGAKRRLDIFAARLQVVF